MNTFFMDFLDENRSKCADTQINSQISELITSSTLSLDALQFIYEICKSSKPQVVLEFGSGLSTRFFCEILYELHKTDFVLVTIDDSKEYLDKTREMVQGFTKGVNSNLNSCIRFVHAPIEPCIFNYRKFMSYSKRQVEGEISSLSNLDLILIDGPLGWKYGREAPLYTIRKKVSPETIIILDDASRPYEQTAIDNWSKVFKHGINHRHYPDIKKGLSLLQLPTNNTIKYPHCLKSHS